MASIAISAPATGATYTYQIRDTAGAWSSAVSMTAGVNDPDRAFSTEGLADELRINVTFPTAQAIDHILIDGLNITSGLTFDITGASTVPTINQHTPTNTRRRERQILRFTEQTSSTYTIDIIGLGQKTLSFYQIALATTGFNPSQAENFSLGASRKRARQVADTLTRQARHRKTRAAVGSFNVSFPKLTTANDDLLDYVVYTQATDQFCIVQLATDDDEGAGNFFAHVALDSSNYVSNTHRAVTATLLEAYAYE